MENKMFHPKRVQFLKEGIRQYPAKVFNLDFIHTQGFTVSDLLTYSYHPDKQVSFRSAWLLEHTCIKLPDLIPGFYAVFINRLAEQQHWGAIRSYTKIIMLATDPKTAIPHTAEQEEILMEQVFNWLIHPECPVAVVVNCLDILYYLSRKHIWIAEELKAQIDYLLKNPTPALASRAKRVLKRLP